MKLNLLPIIDTEGEKLCIDEELDFSAENSCGVIFLSPVKIVGRIINIGGTLELCATVDTTLKLECDRCCESFDYDLDFDMCELMKKASAADIEGGENPDVILLEDNSVDLNKLVCDNIFANLPTKRLCKSDCLGLCPVCGINLNLGSCMCVTETSDPRFDILDSFFKE